MKWFVVLLTVYVAIWWIRTQRQSLHRATNNSPAPTTPQRMVACVQCGTHLPESDALHGPRGFYCSAAHQQQHEA